MYSNRPRHHLRDELWARIGVSMSDVAKLALEQNDPAFELRLLTHAVKDPLLYKSYRPLLRHEFFASESARQFAKIVGDYYDKFGGTPDAVAARDYVTRFSGMTPDAQARILPYVDAVYAGSLCGDKYVEEVVRSVGRQRAMRAAAVAIIAAAEKHDTVDKIEDIMKAALTLSNLTRTEVFSLRDDGAKLLMGFLDNAYKRPVPTGIKELDEKLHGGLQAGELGVIIAPPKRGKSLFLIGATAGALIHERKVLYVTFEDGESSIMSRLCCRLLGRTMPEVKADMGKAVGDLKKVTGMLRSDVRVVYLQPDVAGLNEVDAVLDELGNIDGFVPDLLVLDYADKMRMPGVSDEQEWLRLIRLYTAIRAFGRRRNCAVWSASQTGREGYSLETPDGSNVSGAFGKLGEVDVAIVLCQSKDERGGNTARLSLEALRNRASGGYVKVTMDRERHTIR